MHVKGISSIKGKKQILRNKNVHDITIVCSGIKRYSKTAEIRIFEEMSIITLHLRKLARENKPNMTTKNN